MAAERREVGAQAFAEMARRLRPQDSVRQTLDEIVALAVEMIDGCDEAGVTLVLRRGTRRWIETTAGTGELVAEADALQYELGEGPCLEAVSEMHTLTVEDMAHETRWPTYAPAATRLGVRSALTFQLFTDDNTLGALNLYSRRPRAFDRPAHEVGTVLAAQAAVAVSGARTEEQLREAINTRQIIGQAIGILMERRRITADQAFDLLRRTSQDRNLKLRDLAERVAATGEAPESER
ncbi:MAG: ANTAR domain-containing protein [Streptosporangiales bacterium]|nr:ANTAR domain-containing protein [Streptosporangiales bacterium]